MKSSICRFGAIYQIYTDKINDSVILNDTPVSFDLLSFVYKIVLSLTLTIISHLEQVLQ